MNEMDILKKILLHCTRMGARLFRCNTGTGWVGTNQYRMPDGSLVLKNPVPFRSGLVGGGSDLIGWKSVEITPDMVGRKVAVFHAIEVKAKRGIVSEDQKVFIANVKAAGGIIGVARSEEDYDQIVTEFLSRNRAGV